MPSTDAPELSSKRTMKRWLLFTSDGRELSYITRNLKLSRKYLVPYMGFLEMVPQVCSKSDVDTYILE